MSLIWVWSPCSRCHSPLGPHAHLHLPVPKPQSDLVKSGLVLTGALVHLPGCAKTAVLVVKTLRYFHAIVNFCIGLQIDAFSDQDASYERNGNNSHSYWKPKRTKRSHNTEKQNDLSPGPRAIPSAHFLQYHLESHSREYRSRLYLPASRSLCHQSSPGLDL
ncbi:hypothetical protein J1605_006718 [Eschrichtius robustus]|uniref:Uncharacterized protein n=1 Tax=Eschrichtius robustus TaxID=9764 RepID=A0AB34H2W4_ESCRO|nr:hypothetical protein J1605_006718 [Eschrichtius robustus]